MNFFKIILISFSNILWLGLMTIRLVSWANNVNNCPTRCDYIQFYYSSANSSICFGWYPNPSSGAHANCNYNIWHWSNRICYRPLTWRSRNAVSSETCRAVCRNIIKLYRVTSYWTIIDVDSRCRDPWI